MGTAPINNPHPILTGPGPTPRTTGNLTGTPAPAAPAKPGTAPIKDAALNAKLDPLAVGPEVNLDHINVPNAPQHPGLAGMTMAAAAAMGSIAAFHDQVQGTVRKAAENYQDLQNNLKKLRGEDTAAPTGGLSTSAKIFGGARVLRGITSAAALPGDVSAVANDLQHGDFTKAGIHGLSAAGDMLGTASGVEAGLKLTGLAQSSLKVGEVFSAVPKGSVLSKVPVIGVAFAGVDLAAKGTELFRGVDVNGKPLATNKKVSDIAGMVGDVAGVVAMVTPPPIDAVAGVVAAGAALVQIGADHWNTVKNVASAAEHGVEHAEQAVAHTVSNGMHALGHALSSLF